jgi:AraC-like DNA-binding protein
MDEVVDNRWMPDLDISFRLYAVHRRRVRAAWSYPEHAHGVFEVNVVTHGLQRMKVAGKEWLQRPGDVLWLLPGVRHESLGSADGKEMEYFCIHFAVDDLALRRRLYGLTRVLYERGSELERRLRPALERFLAETAPKGAADKPEAAAGGAGAGLGEAFGVEASRSRGWVPEPGVTPGPDAAGVDQAGVAPGLDDAGMDQADAAKPGAAPGKDAGGADEGGLWAALTAGFAFFAALHEVAAGLPPEPAAKAGSAVELAHRLAAGIERMALGEHPGDGDKTLRTLSAQLGYSPAHCNRVFRQTYGMSPRRYLTLLKLNHAKRLLQDPSRSVEEIAEALGYGDVSQFSKQFKRWTDLSPSAYRQLSH